MQKFKTSSLDNFDNKHKNLIKKIKKKLNSFNYSIFTHNFDIPAYFATYANGPGLHYIQKHLTQKNNFLLSLIHSLKDFFYLLNYNEIKILNYKKITAKKAVFTWAFRENFKRDGSLEDRYLNINTRKLKDIHWIVLYIGEKLPAKIDNNIILIQTINKKKFKPFLLLKVLLSNLKYLFFDYHYFLFSISSHNFLAKKIFTKLNKVIKKPINTVLFIYEAQPFQNQIIKHLKKKNIKTLGYIHSPPLALPTNLVKKKYSPSKIFVNGIDQKKCFIKLGWKKKEIEVIPSTRFLKVKKNFTSQIFLPISIKSSGKILKNLEFLITNIKLDLNEFKIKNHPASIHSRKNNELVNEINKLKKKYSHISKNSSNFKNYSIFLGASGAIIEALERGCKVIQITEIPILDFYSKYFWNSIKSKKINENIFTYSLIKKGNLINLGKKPKNLDLFFNKRTN
tara:strand:- start:1164 stop:2522 length:1359 start_codon:yes stop_codon:yes gene_type:complete